MATPGSTTSFNGNTARKPNEQITFRFCSECSNMLYPKEDEDAHKLQFVCRTCQYTEEAHSSCIFRNELNNSAGETAGVTQDVGSDPTVSDLAASTPTMCLGCGVVIYCAECGDAAPDLAMVKSRNTRVQRSLTSLDFQEFDLSLCLAEDPFAEYDEELMDDYNEANYEDDSRLSSESDISDDDSTRNALGISMPIDKINNTTTLLKYSIFA